MKTKNTKNIAKIIFFILPLFLVGCGNYGMLDTNYSYSYAEISLPSGDIVRGEVEKWWGYEGDQLQVQIDGVIYLTHANNVILTNEVSE